MRRPMLSRIARPSDEASRRGLSACRRRLYSAAARAPRCSPSAMRDASSSTSMPAPVAGRLLGQVAAEGAGARLAVVEAEDVARDIVEPPAGAQVPLDIGDQRLQHGAPRGRRGARRRTAGDRPRPADRGSDRRRGRAPRRRRARGAPAASSSEAMPPLMHDLELGMRRLQAIDARVVERRHLAVLLGRQPLQPGLARVHDEGAAAGVGDRVDEPLEVAPRCPGRRCRCGT